jgi:hypothetical protein
MLSSGEGQIHSLSTLTLGKESLIPIELEAVWAPSPVWTFWTKELLYLESYNLQPSDYTVYTVSAPWVNAVGMNLISKLGSSLSVCWLMKYGTEAQIHMFVWVSVGTANLQVSPP